MKISILTPSYNQAAFIEKNIQSVLAQQYSNFEHIIIDGGSTDNTIEVLEKYPHLIWVSEADEGQADALNKGFALATGDIIGWINSDDYYEENIFTDVLSHFKKNDIQWIIGDITYYYTGLELYKPITSPQITYKNLLNNPDIVKQQGVFFRKKLIEEMDGWKKEFYMIMDYDLWVRISKKYTPKMVHKNYAYFLCHPKQKTSSKNIICQAKEINRILKNNNVSFLSRLPITTRKYWYAIKGIVKSLLISMKVIDESFNNIPLSKVKNSSSN